MGAAGKQHENDKSNATPRHAGPLARFPLTVAGPVRRGVCNDFRARPQGSERTADRHRRRPGSALLFFYFLFRLFVADALPASRGCCGPDATTVTEGVMGASYVVPAGPWALGGGAEAASSICLAGAARTSRTTSARGHRHRGSGPTGDGCTIRRTNLPWHRGNQ